MTGEAKTKQAMDNMYRWTRHVYDASRKYYLLGRDVLIAKLNAKPNEHICEVGCGTARNLRKLARRYPQTFFYGLDASDEMLKTARKNMVLYGVADRVRLEQAFAQNFDPVSLFGISKPLDKIVFSYALSIIPPWKQSINRAVEVLPMGGEIHIVDFGNMEEQSEWFRKLIFWWLEMFHVYHKPEILEYLKELEAQGTGQLVYENLYKGYAYRTVFTKA